MNKKILITGGSGFIGSHLARKLIRLGYKVAINLMQISDKSNDEIKDFCNLIKQYKIDLK